MYKILKPMQMKAHQKVHENVYHEINYAWISNNICHLGAPFSRELLEVASLVSCIQLSTESDFLASRVSVDVYLLHSAGYTEKTQTMEGGSGVARLCLERSLWWPCA